MRDQTWKVTWEDRLKSILGERWSQLRGVLTNPFLEKPILLEDVCGRCGINLTTFLDDVIKVMRDEIAAAEARVRYQIGGLTISELDIERYSVANAMAQGIVEGLKMARRAMVDDLDSVFHNQGQYTNRLLDAVDREIEKRTSPTQGSSSQ